MTTKQLAAAMCETFAEIAERSGIVFVVCAMAREGRDGYVADPIYIGPRVAMASACEIAAKHIAEIPARGTISTIGDGPCGD